MLTIKDALFWKLKDRKILFSTPLYAMFKREQGSLPQFIIINLLAPTPPGPLRGYGVGRWGAA